MIEMTTWVWFTAGFVAGFLHATMLWRATQRLNAWAPVLGFLRLGIVAALLVLSAVAGAILASATGWAVGLASLGTWFMISSGKQTVASSNAHTKSR